MKVILLGDINSPHIYRWVNSLVKKDIKIIVISLSSKESILYPTCVKIYTLNVRQNIIKKQSSFFLKILYLLKLKKINSILKFEKPDIVHAHYASSYGLIGALLNFHPFIVSVWGTDVYEFPRKNILNFLLTKYVLKRSDKILSASNAMAAEINKYTNKNISIIPFGIDLVKFKPVYNIEKDISVIKIGIIKYLEKKYGIDILVKAFNELVNLLKSYNLKLFIVGTGTQEVELKKLVQELRLTNKVQFFGKVDFENISEFHNLLDIAVYPSLEESFGVSIVESSACGKPVIASNIGGIPEVIVNGITGFLINPADLNDLIQKLKILILEKELRIKMGYEGRKFVEKKFDLKKNSDDMILIYNLLIK